MENSIITGFIRATPSENTPDWGEHIGTTCLNILRIGFGQTLVVEKISSAKESLVFSKKVYSLGQRVSAAALSLLLFPVTILLAAIGCIGLVSSKSYQQILSSYINNQKKKQRNSHLVTKAAIVIQKCLRGHQARKAFLSSSLYPQYSVQCESTSKRCPNSIPLAAGGNTKVYLPEETPEVVLKESGRMPAIKRFQEMQFVRTLLAKLGCSHLVIPKAALYKEFLVEERLPIETDCFHNMWLYLSQPEAFDDAVREITKVFSHISLPDLLISNIDSPIVRLVGDSVRYDNIPLYTVEKKGKKVGCIGLIDLENILDENGPGDLATLVRIFPLHLDCITEEATRLQMIIDRETLEEASKKGQKYLQEGFTKHLEWLKQKGELLDTYSLSFHIPHGRKEELTSRVEQELLRLDREASCSSSSCGEKVIGTNRSLFLGNSEEGARELSKTITPLILRGIQVQIEESQNALGTISEMHMTEADFVRIRSPHIKYLEIYDTTASLLYKSPLVTPVAKLQEYTIAERLAHSVMEELVRGGELFAFDKTTDSITQYCWIRY